MDGPSPPTPDDQLIPTQPDYPGPSQQPSEKSLGKRKRIENDKGEDEEQQNSRTSKSTTDVQTRFTQSNIPPALKKCACILPLVQVQFLRGVHGADSLEILIFGLADWHQRYRLFSRYDEGIQMDYDGVYFCHPATVNLY